MLHFRFDNIHQTFNFFLIKKSNIFAWPFHPQGLAGTLIFQFYTLVRTQPVEKIRKSKFDISLAILKKSQHLPWWSVDRLKV
jgi:hypothetical protein